MVDNGNTTGADAAPRDDDDDDDFVSALAGVSITVVLLDLIGCADEAVDDGDTDAGIAKSRRYNNCSSALTVTGVPCSDGMDGGNANGVGSMIAASVLDNGWWP